MSDLQDIREYNAYHLSARAECGEPSKIQREGDVDSFDSPGAAFLDRIRIDFLERFDYAVGEHNGTPTADDIRHAIDVLKDEAAHEIADGAVPVYTYDRWQTFTDLAAWQEDISDLGDVDVSDLTTGVAGAALYIIGERLVVALADELAEWADDIEANESEEDDEETDEIPGGRTIDWTRNEDGHYTGRTSDGRTVDDLGSPFETIEAARAHLAMLVQDHQL